MWSNCKLLIVVAGLFLTVFGIFPVAVSAMYGGNPPPHIARLLDKQMEAFTTVAPIVFAPFKTLVTNEKPPELR
jgi:hypothetical protein